MTHCSILETKVGNDKLWNPGFLYEDKGKIVISIKDMEIREGP